MGKIPKKYIPKHLSQKDHKKQKKNILETRKLYDKKIYKNRPFSRSFKSRKSNHVKRAKEQYGVNSIVASKTLAKRTGCTRKGLRKILKKGRGAYYSSGSRPNQTAQSWARARLASAITGGPASKVDYHILEKECHPNGPALKQAIH
tara:strand:- start:941 stop:1381 length:441 start_codon:yes stop_codon:yes gene_type:complete